MYSQTMLLVFLLVFGACGGGVKSASHRGKTGAGFPDSLLTFPRVDAASPPCEWPASRGSLSDGGHGAMVVRVRAGVIVRRVAA